MSNMLNITYFDEYFTLIDEMMFYCDERTYNN